MSNEQTVKLLKRALSEMEAAGRYKTFKFKKGDRVVIKWTDPNNMGDTGYYLATVDMVRNGMVYCTWDQDKTKTKLPPNDKNWVGYGVKKMLKRSFSDKDVHHYVTEWMNKPKMAENEAGAKRTRVSKKMNEENLQKLEELDPTKEVTELIEESEAIEEALKNEEAPANVDETIAKIRKDLEAIEESDLVDTPIEIEQEQEEAIVENKTRKLGKRLVKTRDRFKKLHGSVEALTVGNTYKMVGTAEELGDFFEEPFKVVGRNIKENDTLYAIEYNGGKGKILASNLPEVTEIEASEALSDLEVGKKYCVIDRARAYKLAEFLERDSEDIIPNKSFYFNVEGINKDPKGNVVYEVYFPYDRLRGSLQRQTLGKVKEV